MKRIVLLTPTLHHYSGIDRVVEEQAKRFAAQGDNVAVFCLDGSIVVPGVEVRKFGMPRSLFLQRVYRLLFFLDIVKVFRMARAVRTYEIVYAHFYPMTIVGWLAKRRYGIVYWTHNYGVPPTSTFPSVFEKVYITLFRWLSNMTIRPADRVVSISRYLADVLKQEIRKDSEVEHISINREAYHSGIDGTLVRKKYGIGADPLVVYIGRISPHKGVDLLIRAFQEARRGIPRARLLIAGKPTFRAYAERLEREAGDGVRFVGFVPEDQLPQYYAAADVYATATLWEGFDMPIAEAQACGTMVVAFDIGPHREIVDERAQLVPVKDVHAFARALEHALSSRSA
ncbi:MAG: glycosyltransferase family 4 protein [Candidatus Kerfeldbacteria bacterium]